MVSRHLRHALVAAACALAGAPLPSQAQSPDAERVVANPAVPLPAHAQSAPAKAVASIEPSPRPTEVVPAAAPAPAETPEDPANQDEIEDESSDLEAMKKAEAAVTDPQAPAAVQLFGGYRRLGGASGLSARMRDVLSPEGAYLPFLPEYAGDAVDTGLATFDIEKAKGEYDIPVEMRPEVAQWVRFFQGAGRKYFVRWLARSTRYIPVMKDILRQEGLPEDMVYLSMIESGFSTMALSWAKASGPWQFIPATGQRFGLKVDFWLDERRDPVKSTRAAARYLRELHDEFGDWYLAWAGYNAGAGKVRKAITKYGTSNFWELCAAGRFLRSETKNYVPKLIAAALVTKHAEAFGFSKAEIDWEQPVETEEVKVETATDVSVVAKAAETDLEELKVLNPELRRWLTPPTKSGESFTLRVPKGKGETFAANWPKLAPKERLVFKIHRVKRGDTLSKIAGTYHSFPEAIMRMNGLRSSKKLRLNTELMIPVASEKEWATAQASTGGAEASKQRHARSGFVPTPAADEVPAGTPAGPVASGPIRRAVVAGKDQVVYGVASGDSLWTISQKFGVTVEEIKGWNELSGRRPKLKIGQELVVYPRAQVAAAAPAPVIQPAVANTPAIAQPVVARAAPAADAVPDKVTMQGNRKQIVHTLVEGDTLWSLSQRYGVSVDALKRMNNLKRRAVLHPGSTLLVEVAERQ